MAILRETIKYRDKRRRELMIRRKLLHWLFVRIAVNGTFTTLYVVLVAITEASSLLRKEAAV